MAPSDHERAYAREWYAAHREKRRAAANQRKRELREWYASLKAGLKCQDCGENHPACIDFHHRDSSEKDTDISLMVLNGRSRVAILREIEKCIVLCSNCHRKRHWAARQED